MRRNGKSNTSDQILIQNLKPHGLFTIRLRILVELPPFPAMVTPSTVPILPIHVGMARLR